MQNTMKQFLKDCLSPVLIRRTRRGKNISFVDNFASWDEAKKYSDGYDKDIILRKCKDVIYKKCLSTS